jgi:hypothetical protein
MDITLQSTKRKAPDRPSFAFIGILAGFLVTLFLPANPGVAVVQPTLFSFLRRFLVTGGIFGLIGGSIDLTLFISQRGPPSTSM